MLEVFVGIATAIVGWILSRLLLLPRMAWGAGVSKRPSGSASTADYVVKFKNVGWFRTIVDLRLNATVVVRNAVQGRTVALRIRLPLSIEEAPTLKAGRNRLATVDTQNLTPYMQQRLRDYGYGDVADDAHRSLEDLLALTDDCRLVVGALGDDSWSGARRYVEKEYRLADVRPLFFAVGGDTVEARIRAAMHRVGAQINRLATSGPSRRHPTLRFGERATGAEQDPRV